MQLADLTLKREKRKRDVLQNQLDVQTLQIRLRHEPKSAHEGIEAEFRAELAARKERRALEERQEMVNGASASGPEPSGVRMGLGLVVPRLAFGAFKSKRTKNAQRDMRDPQVRKRALEAVSVLPPPPMQPDLDMLFTAPVDITQAVADAGINLPAGVDLRRCRARFGRGGRLVIDRCDPVSRELLSEEEVAAHVAATRSARLQPLMHPTEHVPRLQLQEVKSEPMEVN